MPSVLDECISEVGRGSCANAIKKNWRDCRADFLGFCVRIGQKFGKWINMLAIWVF